MSFDPLLVFFGSVTADKSGWYTCAAGNAEGRSEISTYLDIRAGKTMRIFHAQKYQDWLIGEYVVARNFFLL